MGAAGTLGIASMFGTFPVVRAEAESTASVATIDGPASVGSEDDPYENLAEIQQAEIEAAKAQNRRLDPIKFVTTKSRDELNEMLEDEAMVTEDYTTPGGKVIPAIYLRLRNRINRCAAGIGSICPGDDHWDVLMNFYSEKDAQNILAMPVSRTVTAADYAERCGIPEAEAAEILDGLADRSLIWRIRRSGMAHYQIMAQIPGYWEWHELWEGVYGTDESMLLFNRGCDSAWGEDNPLASLYRSMVHVQACDNSVVEGVVPPFCDWEASLDRFDVFAVMPCQCRTKGLNYGTVTEEDCGRMDTCTSMGEIAEYFISIGVAREITREEARANIRLNVEEGNTIEGYCTKTGGAYCACNMKVCLFANAYKKFGGNVNSFEYVSDFNLAYDKDTCIKCGACLERCPMDAIEADENGLMVPTAVCFRCGQCAMVCPVGARKLVPKEKWETIERAADLFEDNLSAAQAHMALGGIVDFTGDVEAVRAAVKFQPFAM